MAELNGKSVVPGDSETKAISRLVVLTREDIYKAKDIKYEFVPVPEWAPDDVPEDQRDQVGVWVRGMNGEERDRMEREMMIVRNNAPELNLDGMMYNFKAKMVARCVVENEGSTRRMFSEGDIEWLGQKSAVALGRVTDVINRISAISKSDMEEMTKNSDTGQSEESTSAFALPPED